MSGEPTLPTGYATHEEILAVLNELLEAERAGARVALGTRKATEHPATVDLMAAVHTAEARWCAMLAGQIRRLGGAPSRRCGMFHQKAMAIADLGERLAFLNKGQLWVVRQLDSLIPRIRDEELHADLRAMAGDHRANIDRTDQVLAAMARAGFPD